MGSSQICFLLGSTKEDFDQAQSLSSNSQDDSPLTEVLALDQILLNFPDYQDLDSILEGSNESDGSMTEYAVKFPNSRTDRLSEIEGDSTNHEVNRAKLTRSEDFQDVEKQK